MGISELICAAIISLNLPNTDIACKHMDTVVEASANHGVSPELMVALIYVESSWKPMAKSRAGACGLTQVMPKYTGGKATEGKKYTCSELLENPELSIRVGTKIYSWWLKGYAKCNYSSCEKRKVLTSLCGYNAGFRCKGKNVNKSGMSYARKVTRIENKIKKAVTRLSEGEK